MSTRRGSEESVTIAPIWPWGLSLQPTICLPVRVLVARARSESSKGREE